MRRIVRASLLILIAGCTTTGTAEPSATFPSPTVSLAPSPTLAPTPPPPSPSTPPPSPTSAPSVAAGCPISPLRVDELLADGATCYGGQAVTVIGWLAPAWGIGGVESGIEPSWLGEMPPDPVLWHQPRNPNGCFDDDDCVWTFLHRAPGATGLDGPDRWVAVTGHFQDPVAETCLWGGTICVPISTEDAIERCRGAFVVTAVEDTTEP